MDMHRICNNCGAEFGLHHADTNQCPKNGREAPIGRRQGWATTVFEEQPQISQDAAKALLEVCKGILKLNSHRLDTDLKIALEAAIVLAGKSKY